MLLRLIAGFAVLTFGVTLPAVASDKLDTIVKTAMSGSAVPAIGAVVLREGKVAEQAFAGVRRNDGKQAVGPDDVWLIGSTGKVMTVALVARLVERGTLHWDTALDKMLPELAEDMHPAYRKVTLLHLLSHRAGLPRDLKDSKALDTFFTDKRPLPAQRLAYVGAALKDAPDSGDGSGFNYSNTGFLIAAAIAEKVSGLSYEVLMAKEVFQPLGMRHAGLGDTGKMQNRGHQRGRPMMNMTRSDDGAPAMFAPAGFLHMSMGDWALFNLDQLAGSRGQGKLLTPASYRLMQTAQPGSPAGLDWGVQPSIAGRAGPALVHQGSDGNWLAIVVLFPEQGTGVMAVANAGPDMGADKVLNSVFGQLFPALSPAKQAAPQ